MAAVSGYSYENCEVAAGVLFGGAAVKKAIYYQREKAAGTLKRGRTVKGGEEGGEEGSEEGGEEGGAVSRKQSRANRDADELKAGETVPRGKPAQFRRAAE